MPGAGYSRPMQLRGARDSQSHSGETLFNISFRPSWSVTRSMTLPEYPPLSRGTRSTIWPVKLVSEGFVMGAFLPVCRRPPADVDRCTLNL